MNGLTYDNPARISYNEVSIDFGAGTTTFPIRVPRGVTRGRIEEILIHDITEDFTDDTTEGGVQIGDGTDADKYCDMRIPDAADVGANFNLADALAIDADTLKNQLGDNDLAGPGVFDVGASGDDIAEIVATYLAPTGGTPGGIAAVTIVIAWW